VRNNLERRIARLEERWRLAREQAAWAKVIESDSAPTDYFERLRVQLHERQGAPLEARITAATGELDTLDAEIARARTVRTDPHARRLLEYCRRHCEIDLLELKGEISHEQLWAAREQASSAARGAAAFAPIPTHEKALELLESGTVGCYSFMPAHCRSRAPERTLTRSSLSHAEEPEGFAGFILERDDAEGA
jgi:hypothetical protein